VERAAPKECPFVITRREERQGRRASAIRRGHPFLGWVGDMGARTGSGLEAIHAIPDREKGRLDGQRMSKAKGGVSLEVTRKSWKQIEQLKLESALNGQDQKEVKRYGLTREDDLRETRGQEREGLGHRGDGAEPSSLVTL
jgi:hypothetical protein